MFDVSTLSYIIPISSTDTTGIIPSNLTSPLIVKSTGNSSYGIGTGAIAGIAIVIVLIALLISVFFVCRIYCKKRNRKAKLPGNEPKVRPGILDIQKYNSLEDLEVKFKQSTTIIIVTAETPIIPLSKIKDKEFFGPNRL